MKRVIRQTLLLAFLIHHLTTIGQSPSKHYQFDPEPFRPFFVAFNVLPTSEIVDGELVWTDESEEEYEERDAKYEKQQYEDYLNSAAYKQWLEEHVQWRERNPDWKKKTKYPELVSPNKETQTQQIVTSPELKVGETYIVSVQTLNVRSGANKTTSLIGTLKIHDNVKLINADNENWWLVDNGVIQGYVFSQYLKPDPFSSWEKTEYRTGATPECENVEPKYDHTIDNYLKVNVGSNTDVVIKLMKVGSYQDICVRIVYVRSGETYSLKNIPEGRYYLKIAYGKDYRQKIVDNTCYVKFTKNALYEKGTEILDYYKIKKPDQRIGSSIYESWDVPSFELFLDVIASTYDTDTFQADEISEMEFNK